MFARAVHSSDTSALTEMTTVYCGRTRSAGSQYQLALYALGNPYRVKGDTARTLAREEGITPRQASVKLYKKWLWSKMVRKDKEVMAALNTLLRIEREQGAVALVCHCRLDQECHTEVIAGALHYLKNKEAGA